MIDDIAARWSRELGADVEIEQHVWTEGIDFNIRLDGRYAHTAHTVYDAEDFLAKLSMLTEREVDGY